MPPKKSNTSTKTTKPKIEKKPKAKTSVVTESVAAPIVNSPYYCAICNKDNSQSSHHKKHLGYKTHLKEKKILKLELEKLTQEERIAKYKLSDIEEILTMQETYNPDKLEEVVLLNELEEHPELSAISNKEALRDKIHEIHNLLRNNGAGYGMNSLKVFNILYGLMRIEDAGLIDKVGLKRPECEFAYLVDLAKANKGQEIVDALIGPILTSIHSTIESDKTSIGDILFYEIPRKISPTGFCQLIKEIRSLTLIQKTCNVQLSGKIYEYFIGRDDTAISELGAYFTDRHIVNYNYDMYKPQLNPDGSLPTMIDPFGGSGGFTTGYINYFMNKGVNWTTEINKVYHTDMNEDVIKAAALEFFCLTGEMPDMKKNCVYKNSFADEFADDEGNLMRFDNVVTNPPYGGDKTEKSDAMIKREKLKNKLKDMIANTANNSVMIEKLQKQFKRIEGEEKLEKLNTDKVKVSIANSSKRIRDYAEKHGLASNDKEGTSLILLMDLVKENGNCIGVLKEGVFFNKVYSKLREHLIKNYNVVRVVSIPGDQFENTTTKTSTLWFKNTEEKTSAIEFYELDVLKYKEDKFEIMNDVLVLTECEGDIYDVKDRFVSTASVEELEANNWSLNGKEYNKKEVVVGSSFELKQIANILEMQPKSKRPASFGNENGTYNFYTSSDKIQKCQVVDYKDDDLIIIGNGGVGAIHLDKNFSCSSHCFVLKSTTINVKLVYFLMLSQWNRLIENMNGSTLKNLSLKSLLNFQLAIPNTEAKLNEWVNKITAIYNDKNTKSMQMNQLDQKILSMVKEISDKEECKSYLFKDCFDIKTGKLNKRDLLDNGQYPYYNASVNNPIGRTDKLSFTGDKYIIMIRCGGNAKNKVSLDHALGQVFQVEGTIGANEGVYQLNVTNDTDVTYLYYYLRLQTSYLQETAHYSTGIGNIHKDNLRNLEIRVPISVTVLKNLQSEFILLDKLKKEVTTLTNMYDSLIIQLGKEAIIA